jgi:carbohydrate-binding DOMON domain-containing protein
MKKFLLLSTLVAGLLVAGGCGAEKTASTVTKAESSSVATTSSASSSGTVIFEMADKVGDDNGPGVYTYPTDRVFKPGSFDLTNFKLTDAGSTYDFEFTIPIDFKNDWKNAGGWDVQMFDVYMNLGTGTHEVTVSGRNVKIAEKWDVALVVGPAKGDRMRKEIDDKNTDVADDVSDFEDIADNVYIPDAIAIAGNKLTAKIDKAKIGDLSKMTGIQVFVLSSEGYPTKIDTYNRVVNEFSAQWRFGGGSDYDGDPNVIDILGDNDALGNYKSDEGVAEFATVNLIPVK